MNKVKFCRVMAGALLSAFVLSPVVAQVKTEAPPVVEGAKPVTLERLKVHSASIEGNLMGESADRDVFVFLPPSYAKNKRQRYPVVYALHGYFIGAEQWIGEIHVPQTIEGAFANGAREMIVVFPDSKNAYNGSMYSSSVTTGDFENFIARDVVQYIDAHYRTIATRQSRGLVGHSMGGYGASRIGMKHADVFGSLYLMSPCCLSVRDPGPYNAEIQQQLESVKTPAESEKINFWVRATFAMAAAWSPNPNNPPLYLDLPFKNGELQKDVMDRWTANAPLTFMGQYIEELKRYKRIAIDVGDQDGLKVDTEKLHVILDSYHVDNSFEIYEGTHTSRVAFRIQNNVIPFFSDSLCFKNPCDK